MDTSKLTFFVTSDNFSGQPSSAQQHALSSSSSLPSSRSSSSESPSAAEYRLQLAEHIQSFTAAFLSSHPGLTAADKQAVLALSAAAQPAAPPSPSVRPRRVRAYIDGCYDVCHSGHYNAIRQARSLCDELVLGLHTDAEILHHKGPTVMNDEERVAAVCACKWIDQVVFGVPYDPSVELLDALGCDFAVHGDDQSVTATGEDAFAAVKAVGRMRIVKRTEGISTTDIVGRLLALGRLKSQRKALQLSPSSTAVAMSQAALPPRVSTFLPVSFRISQFCNNRRPERSDVVVYIAGDFDLFHLAHIDMLQRARALGTFLYVGVYDDAECERIKGEPGHPVMSMFERVLNVLACRHVDEVVMGVKRHVSQDMITSLNITHVVDSERSEQRRIARKAAAQGAPQGREQNGAAEEREVEDDDGYAAARAVGAYRLLELERDLSTDAVIDRILTNQDKYEKRNSKRSTKEHDYFSNKQYVEERSNRLV